jgi:aspartate kinase
MPSLIPLKPWTVHKYGGTSLGKLLPAITGSIIPSYLEANRLVVVCSALSGTSESYGTTSLLLQAIQNALSSQKSQCELNKTIDSIVSDHLGVSKKIFLGSDKIDHTSVKKELEDGIIKDCDGLRRFLIAAQVCQ